MLHIWCPCQNSQILSGFLKAGLLVNIQILCRLVEVSSFGASINSIASASVEVPVGSAREAAPDVCWQMTEDMKYMCVTHQHHPIM